MPKPVKAAPQNPIEIILSLDGKRRGTISKYGGTFKAYCPPQRSNQFKYLEKAREWLQQEIEKPGLPTERQHDSTRIKVSVKLPTGEELSIECGLSDYEYRVALSRAKVLAAAARGMLVTKRKEERRAEEELVRERVERFKDLDIVDLPPEYWDLEEEEVPKAETKQGEP